IPHNMRDHRDHRDEPPPPRQPPPEPPSQPPPVVRDHRGEPPPPSQPSPEVRDHRGEAPSRPAPEHDEQPGFGDVVRDHRTSGIKHIFVLMLENRSFDHMLGFSGITGTDAKTGQPTAIEGMTGSESNQVGDQVYGVVTGAADVMGTGPAHNFLDVLEQLCGADATYTSGQAYPTQITNSGFASSYESLAGPGSGGEAMKCFASDRLPVLNALAREFVVCDHWFSSMPGPTEPNRMFVHAATSGAFDDSPSNTEIGESILLPDSGIAFKHGTIFKLLDDAGVKYRIYADDHFPNVAELHDVSVWSIQEFENFADDLNDDDFDASYVFIEPSYDALDTYDDGNSQHPNGSVAAGERFIKATYEAIRQSPLWPSSLLVITWDEHGGFYDHAPPPPAVPTGSVGRDHGFTFAELGPRVPAIVVSPLIPRNLIEHRVFDHAAIPATLERVFNLPSSLTSRDGGNGVNNLATLSTPRTDAPVTLPDPTAAAVAAQRLPLSETVARQPGALVANDRHGNVAGLIRSAVAQHLKVAPAAEHEAILEQAKQLRTHADVQAYLQEVHIAVTAVRTSGAAVVPMTARDRIRTGPARRLGSSADS